MPLSGSQGNLWHPEGWKLGPDSLWAQTPPRLEDEQREAAVSSSVKVRWQQVTPAGDVHTWQEGVLHFINRCLCSKHGNWDQKEAGRVFKAGRDLEPCAGSRLYLCVAIPSDLPETEQIDPRGLGNAKPKLQTQI